MYIDLPLILISQERRSGGTLLSQLLDGHPQLYVHPGELKTGYPIKTEWPPIDTKEKWTWNYNLIHDKKAKHLDRGYKKSELSDRYLEKYLPTFVTRHLFKHYWDTTVPTTHRDVFDIYFTSYFGSWLDYHPFINGYRPKKYTAAFCPALMNTKKKIEHFFDLYPEGKHLAILRDPVNWYFSAKNHGEMNAQPAFHSGLEDILSKWSEAVSGIIQSKKQFSQNVTIIRFEDLITKTEQVMHIVASKLGIDFHDCLLTPSFNGRLIESSSNFFKGLPGEIDKSSLSHHVGNVTDDDNMKISELCRALHYDCSELAERC